MARFFPADIHLPAWARYYSFVETKKRFNSNYDITWSFQYKLPSEGLVGAKWPRNQVGFATFLTTLSSPTSAFPGQYLGDQSPFLLSGEKLLPQGGYTIGPITTETNQIIIVNSAALTGTLVKVAFDTTGLYALSSGMGEGTAANPLSATRKGVGMDRTNPQSFIVRNFNDDVISNAPLTAMSPNFQLSTNEWRTIRCRYANLGQTLHVHFRDSNTTTYSKLTTINLGYRIANYNDLDNICVGFSFCTPISCNVNICSDTLSADKFFLKNFHIEGYAGSVTTETLTSTELSVNPNTNTTTVTNVTAL